MNEPNTTPGLNGILTRISDWLGGKDQRLAQLESQVANLAQIQAQLDQANNDLVTAKQTIKTLETKIETTEKAHAEALTQKEAEVSTRANTIAAQRLATVGVPAIKEETKTQDESGDLLKQFAEEPDPKKRESIFSKIRGQKWNRN